ncbi:TetR/AcrR family transcriptional regulator [Micromonospora sp. LH3U1]|uniref:TetR/AcrR family transcriptional regulator n=1 Tax=Micromonospora sp. LH3U1 TaxID=3018339 RepID=UPI00234B8C27|nr:TetR/AcrR family transcriptional regulator [Micromonospora sp. LH3U1]WCN83544.1 TetR/AcrR family transcriptional regulator [Micromonospora sp. LH3U1]
MPTPDRTSLADIVAAARQILESEGLPGLTMQAVAQRVGVRAPSLYKRVRNRDDLIRLVTEATVHDLGEQLTVAGSGDPGRDLAELAHAFRAFAHAQPAGYHLIFTSGPADTRPSLDILTRATAPALRLAAELAGPEHALSAARMFTAWANGFISMELAGAFNLGGDLDEAFAFGIDRLTAALTTLDPPRPSFDTGRTPGTTPPRHGRQPRPAE